MTDPPLPKFTHTTHGQWTHKQRVLNAHSASRLGASTFYHLLPLAYQSIPPLSVKDKAT